MQKTSSTPLSRRDFGKMAVTAAGLSVVPSLLGAATPEAKPVSGDVEEKSAAAVPAAEEPSAEAVALAGIVKLRYGSRLDDAAMKEITRSLDGSLKGAAALRKVPLDNSDEPAFVFKAWRSTRG